MSNNIYDEFGKLIFIGIGLYILLFPITIPITIYYILTEKPEEPYKPQEPIKLSEEERKELDRKYGRPKIRSHR